MHLRKMVNKSGKGFTLIELITVIAIVSLLVVYITFELGSTNEDAKVSMATTFFVGNVPAAISAYRARNMNSCDALNLLEEGPIAPEIAIRDELVRSGLPEFTPWGERWTAAYSRDARRLYIIFPFTGSEDPVRAARAIVNNLWGAPQIDAILGANADPLTVAFAEYVDDDSFSAIPGVNTAIAATDGYMNQMDFTAEEDDPLRDLPSDLDSTTVDGTPIGVAYDCL